VNAKQRRISVVAVLLSGIVVVAAWIVRERHRSAIVSCVAQLKMIEAAKNRWAFEEKKMINDVPIWNDLIGRYISEKPVCPQGGNYTLHSVGESATCTFPGHTL
jgi:hypothetical protein